MVFCGHGHTSIFRTQHKTDADIIRENHQFVWEDGEDSVSWDKQLAKKYYDKLFKEYCLADLTRYKENKVRKSFFLCSSILPTGKKIYIELTYSIPVHLCSSNCSIGLHIQIFKR